MLRESRLLVRPLAVLALCAAAGAGAEPRGISGYSGMDGVTCSECHSGGASPTLAISGPTAVAPGQPADYALTVTGGPGVVAGLGVAVDSGQLLPTEAGTRLRDGELTHSAPRPFQSGAAIFNFRWVAPPTPGTAKLFAAALSANGNGGDSGDGVGALTLDITIDQAADGGAVPAVDAGAPDAGSVACVEGATRVCFSGDPGLVGVGSCRAGTQTCRGGSWSECEGENAEPGCESDGSIVEEPPPPPKVGCTAAAAPLAPLAFLLGLLVRSRRRRST